MAVSAVPMPQNAAGAANVRKHHKPKAALEKYQMMCYI